MAYADSANTTSLPSRARTPSPLDTVVHNAGRQLLALQMTRLTNYPDLDDAKALNDDMDALCTIIDPVIEAIGDYASSHFNGIDLSLFRSQLRGALEGMAMFTIESVGEWVEEDRAYEAA